MLLPLKDFEQLYNDFHTQAEIKRASDFESTVAAIRDGIVRGVKLQTFGKQDFEIREGEITIIAGASGHGKSLLTGQLALEFAKQAKRTCIMSFEMTPARTLDRMLSQCCGRSADTDTVLDVLQRIGDKICVLDKVGGVTPKFVYGAIISAVKEFKCSQIVIDNLMKVCDEFGEDGMNGTKNFVATLCELAKALHCHIWLVHHVRKSEKETDKIDKYSIRGAAVVTDQADNILILQRNIAKEQKQASQGFDAQLDNDEPDATLSVVKQRNGSWQGQIPLWFEAEHLFYSTTPSRTVGDFSFKRKEQTK